MSKKLNRRSFVKKSLTVSTGLALASSLTEKALQANPFVNRGSGIVNRVPNHEARTTNHYPRSTHVLAQTGSGLGMPMGKIGKLQISRLICGGNLIIGSAHCRDLRYIPDLMKHYFTDRKIIETWQLCKESGINTIIGPVNSPYARGEDPTIRMYRRYRDEFGGQLQWIAQTYPKTNDFSTIQIAIDNGAVGGFIHGGIGDSCVRRNQIDLLVKAIEFIKKNGLIAGCGCHDIRVPMALEKEGIEFDFYMKTLHHDNYSYVLPKEERSKYFGSAPADNMWDLRSQDSIEFMKNVKKSWIAFKVLAAGAIHPLSGFRYAFQNGADFISVGMFDFQIREDTIIARDIINEIQQKGRPRPWI